ncbi:MAG: hypothetical protein RMK45_05175 [Armatimonadota bacterium]|nr:hypothetical protein [Armatimonadota bacterium]
MRKEGYCAFGAEQVVQAVQSLQQAMESLEPHNIQTVARAQQDAHQLQTCLTLFRGCYPKTRVALWKRRLRRVIRALNALHDTLRLAQWVQSLSPPVVARAGVARALLRLRQQADAQAKVLQRAWHRWLATHAPNELIGLSRRWRESFVSEPPDCAYVQRVWQLFHREQVSALELGTGQSLEVRCGRLRALIEAHTLLQPLLGAGAGDALEAEWCALEAMRFRQYALQTLAALQETERERTLNHTGNLRGFSRIQRGLQWLVEQAQGAGNHLSERESE